MPPIRREVCELLRAAAGGNRWNPDPEALRAHRIHIGLGSIGYCATRSPLGRRGSQRRVAARARVIRERWLDPQKPLEGSNLTD
jgi:hypothetical protein